MVNKLLRIMLATGLAIAAVAITTGAVQAGTKGVVTGEVVNVREYGEINDTNRLFQVRRGEEVSIHGISGDFFRVTVADQYGVYISREWVSISETVGTTIGNANVYNIPPEMGGHMLTTVGVGEVLNIRSMVDGWLGIDFWGETAFIPVYSVNAPFIEALPTARISGQNGLAGEIISFAMNYLGRPHVMGGNGPNSFDCSGFMSYILRHHGISVNRSSFDMARNGTHVYRQDIQPGDLLFFTTNGTGRISHVGMYMGGGEMIHAASWNTGVRIDNINQQYYVSRFVTARRVI
ncbi:MAG: C40 family peptidase [Defluviitaleaceae bacterium]|nr:C40 family peptidase [Defluviitaleaceae bacterium]